MFKNAFHRLKSTPARTARRRAKGFMLVAIVTLCVIWAGSVSAKFVVNVASDQTPPDKALDQVQRSVKNSSQPSGLPTSAQHVHARAQLDRRHHRLVVTVSVDSGYHINANPASKKFLIPTTLMVSGVPDSAVAYPTAEHFKAPYLPGGIAVYVGTIKIAASIPAILSLPAEAKLRVQACSARYCLIPSTLDVPLERNRKPKKP